VPELFRFALVALVCFTGPAASAMGVRKDSTLLARSDDGAALFEVREHGPEGGGALTYRVEGKRRSAAVEFLASSDFSPGNGSRPQRVSATECEQRVTALGAELARRNIAGVTVHPENCRAKHRDGLVVVAKSPR
jgi:hypothetical protein